MARHDLPTDLLLNVDAVPLAVDAGRMRLLDAPKIDREERQRGFDWKPTLALLALGGIALVGALFL